MDTEKYVIEIVCRSRTLQSCCRKLLSREFASSSPLHLAETILGLCRHVENGTIRMYQSILANKKCGYHELIEPDLELLKKADFVLHNLGAHLRFVDGSISKKLPWSIIKPFEKLSGRIIPHTSFMFRPQWKYNFSVLIEDLRKLYEEYTTAFEVFTGPEKNSVLNMFKTPFYIISFPSIERKNILLHSLLGHELGHLIVKNYVDKDLEKNFIGRIGATIRHYILEEYEKDGSDLDMFRRVRANADIALAISFALQVWRRGLEEILSDIIGTLIFGPALLFSFFELSFQKDLDHTPDAEVNFYPAWRYRLRHIINILQRPRKRFFPIPEKYFNSQDTYNKISRSFNIIKEVTEKDDDRVLIKKQRKIDLAYREIEADITDIIKSTNYFKKELASLHLSPNKLYKDIEHLIMRLDAGLPPNAIERSIDDRRPASLVEIINAACFFKLSKLSKNQTLLSEDGRLNNEVISNKDTMNRLTLKAIEYSDIEMEYSKQKKG